MPLFNFGNSLVPHVQRLDGNPMVGRLSWNTSAAGIGAYYLEDLDERTVLHPWNVNNLKMYYY